MNNIKVLFIHHSTGGLLLHFGRVRTLLKQKAPNIKLWDHGYNLYNSIIFSRILGPLTFKTGLSDSNGKMTGKDFNIIVSNNSPKEYAGIFARKPSDFTLSNILKFDVIMFKNCFPTTKIETKEKLWQYKKYYSNIINRVSKFSNKFIIFTPPPLRFETTKSEWAENARELSDWLCKQEGGNVSVFNFFDLLADKRRNNANMLRRDYCGLIPIDSHPNIKANREVGKLFTDYLIKLLSI